MCECDWLVDTIDAPSIHNTADNTTIFLLSLSLAPMMPSHGTCDPV